MFIPKVTFPLALSATLFAGSFEAVPAAPIIEKKTTTTTTTTTGKKDKDND